MGASISWHLAFSKHGFSIAISAAQRAHAPPPAAGRFPSPLTDTLPAPFQRYLRQGAGASPLASAARLGRARFSSRAKTLFTGRDRLLGRAPEVALIGRLARTDIFAHARIKSGGIISLGVPQFSRFAQCSPAAPRGFRIRRLRTCWLCFHIAVQNSTSAPMIAHTAAGDFDADIIFMTWSRFVNDIFSIRSFTARPLISACSFIHAFYIGA